jgi:hypothetical protein
MRHEDWPKRLQGLINESERKPFAWGSHDCCLFAARAVEVITGIDHAATLRGTYSTALEAARILQARGGVRGIATAALGDEIPCLTAQRGDIVLIESDHGEALGVCLGADCAVPGPDSLTRVPLLSILAAWRVK